MVTRIGKGRRQHLYITEWFEHLGLDDTKVAGRLDMDRTTIFKWRKEQHRLDPDKIAALADALGIEPQQLWSLPGRRSLDAMLVGAPNEVVDTAADIVERLVRKAS
jgi:transcriptional regulator with XRE-family HTH domain